MEDQSDVSDDELDSRIVASDFLRPHVCRAIADESETSLECVTLVAGVIAGMNESPECERLLIDGVKELIRKCMKLTRDEGSPR